MILCRSFLPGALCAALMLGGCGGVNGDGEGRRESARDFPQADRPVSPIVSVRYSSEEARDRVGEANDIMDHAHVAPGMTVADIGAGEGYYTVRLAKRVGRDGRVLAEDIMPEVIDALGQRINREDWTNVSVRLGAPDDPKLPEHSFDRIFMVHMYHEIDEPYAFLWHMRPALKTNGEVIVVDSDRPTAEHGTPPKLLACEFASVGYRLEEMIPRPASGGYFARFKPIGARPAPEAISPCKLVKEPVGRHSNSQAE